MINKLFYNIFSLKKKPTSIELRFSFYGKCSDDVLYVAVEKFPIKLEMKKEYVMSGDFGSWRVVNILEKDFADFIKKKSKEQLIIARQKKLITTKNNGKRITGDYIVAVDCDLWITNYDYLSYDEWVKLK